MDGCVDIVYKVYIKKTNKIRDVFCGEGLIDWF